MTALVAVAVWVLLPAVAFAAGWVACLAVHRRQWGEAASWGDSDRTHWLQWVTPPPVSRSPQPKVALFDGSHHPDWEGTP